MHNEDHQSAVIQAIEYMKEHLDEELTSVELARKAGYSPYHFSRIFKAVTGISPRQYLSALRIEAGKTHLLEAPSLMVKILRRIGFSSLGSFQSRFKNYVGVSPRKFRSLSHELHGYVNQYEETALPLQIEQEEGFLPRVRCYVEAPPSFKGIIFVGLFPRPIPDQRPTTGSALNLRNRSCTFTGVPPGTYYALAAGIPWSLNPKDYFLLDKCLRAKADEPLYITAGTDVEITLTLREPLPVDPPIIINLPLLLFEKEQDSRKNRKAEEF